MKKVFLFIFFLAISLSQQQANAPNRAFLAQQNGINSKQQLLQQTDDSGQETSIDSNLQKESIRDSSINTTIQQLNEVDPVDQQAEGSTPNTGNESTSNKIEKEIEWSLLFLLGLFCTAVGVSFEWKNEQYFIRYLRLLDTIRSRCKTSEFSEGDLIFLSGKVNYNYNLADPLLNLNIEKAVKIFRKIEMVQYEEKNKKDDDVDENGNIRANRLNNSSRGTKSNDYVKKWISYRVPILNFKNQDKIQKSQKYCKFIAETDQFHVSRISLQLPNQSPIINQIGSPTITPIHLQNNQNFTNSAQNPSNDGAPLTLKLHNSIKNLLTSAAGNGNSQLNTPDRTPHMNHSGSQPNIGHGVQKVYISDLTCFDEFPQQQFNYNQLTNNEKDLIINKIEDLRRLQVTFQDWQFDTNVLFKDNEVIISRKQDCKMHLGDNKMEHFYTYADEISIIGKLGSKGMLLPYFSIQESNEDIELDDMDDINNSPLLKKRNQTLPFLSLKASTFAVNGASQCQTVGTLSSTVNNQERLRQSNESAFSYYLCFVPRLMKTIFAFDDKVYWALDRVVSLEEFLVIKRQQFSKLVTLCRYISFALIFVSMYLCIFPILNVFGFIDVDSLENNQPFYIKLFVALLSTLAIILCLIFPLYTVYKFQYGLIILPSLLLLLYIIRDLSI